MISIRVKKKKGEYKIDSTYPIIVLVAIMKSVTSVFITFALKSFDFVWMLRNLSGLTRNRYTPLVLSPTWSVSFKCAVNLLRSWGWHKSFIAVPISSCNEKPRTQCNYNRRLLDRNRRHFHLKNNRSTIYDLNSI